MEKFDLSQYGTARAVAIILARDEEKTIEKAVRGAARFVHEVYVVDGRSSDTTREVAREAGATVVRDNGQGKGAAIRQGIRIAKADIIVFMDADGSHDPNDIPRLVLPIVTGETDLCIGSRFSGGSDELSVNLGQLIRTIGNVLMNIAINKRWNTELTDTLNGFRAARREAISAVGLREKKHTIEQEMVMKMLSRGYHVMNVPTHEYPREFGESHIHIWKEWPLFVWCVAINIIRHNQPKPVHRKKYIAEQSAAQEVC